MIQACGDTYTITLYALISCTLIRHSMSPRFLATKTLQDLILHADTKVMCAFETQITLCGPTQAHLMTNILKYFRLFKTVFI